MSYSPKDLTDFTSLAELAGIQAGPGILGILIQLLSLQVSPEDIYVLLKQISPVFQQKKKTQN
ncbi:uncharacterized protein LOC111643072 [Copidosoma floridanum]|uniref:uncharacterized protein LOC111643072 n=1 Tax=Copidosoma floridanum TaxID=29053 RepID=UPI000C6FA790|nr:uncharacterized protein LOC111643072 [Copidosoma floridanum]